MAWVVDTCVLLDVLENDPAHGARSAKLLGKKLGAGLLLCPVTFVELAPAFDGSAELQEEFCNGVGVAFREPWTFQDSRAAHASWAQHIRRRRTGAAPKQPIADVLIGAFACRFEGIITRNASDFRRLFPSLQIAEP